MIILASFIATTSTNLSLTTTQIDNQLKNWNTLSDSFTNLNECTLI